MSERNDEIIRLRKQGWPPCKITAHLGLSRNVILGVLNRAGLCDPNVDRAAHARRGSANAGARLTDDQVRAIRKRVKLFCPKDGISALSIEFKVGRSTIERAVRRESYKDVT